MSSNILDLCDQFVEMCRKVTGDDKLVIFVLEKSEGGVSFPHPRCLSLTALKNIHSLQGPEAFVTTLIDNGVIAESSRGAWTALVSGKYSDDQTAARAVGNDLNVLFGGMTAVIMCEAHKQARYQLAGFVISLSSEDSGVSLPTGV